MIIYVMGVSGCGKTTIGTLLSEKLVIPFFDGDDFHSDFNIEKMKSGKPLNDTDRQGWLENINSKAKKESHQNNSVVFACSALKIKYRDILSEGLEDVVWIYLDGSFELITERLKKRVGHFMPPELLKSQFATLEIPLNAIIVNLNNCIETIIENILIDMNKNEFGLVGLGVMGKSLARNLARNGTKLSLYNRYVAGFEEKIAETFIEEHIELEKCAGFEGLSDFVNSLSKPRKIFLMIKAGPDTDVFLESLSPYLDKGDIVIDGGNSHFKDTAQRITKLANKGIHFIGTGVSGGEKGALEGPSIMPSGDKDAYDIIKPYFEKIAAKDKDSLPCCSYIGKEGSGHFIKTVHNGIEYAEMQILAETYALLRYSLGKTPSEISEIFLEWNNSDLRSYLLEITGKLLLKKDEKGNDLIDIILDKAGNKGTGNWTSVEAIQNGFPATMISSALFSRYLSTTKFQNTPLVSQSSKTDIKLELNSIKEAYALARIINHQQGFQFIEESSNHYGWNLNLSEIARIWTNGCIIRSTLMESLVIEFKECNSNLLESESFRLSIVSKKVFLKQTTINLINSDIPAPCYLSALDYINTLEDRVKTANIIQAQRDFFGAHNYQRVNDASGAHYHTEWE